MSFLMSMKAVMLAEQAQIPDYVVYIILGVLAVGVIVLPLLSNKKRQKEYQNMQNELKPGTRVMTIGRMIGRIVRVYDDNTIEVDVGTADAPVVITVSREAIGINLDAQAAQQAAQAAKAAGKAPAQVEDKKFEESNAEEVGTQAAAEEKSDIPEIKPENKDDAI